MTSKIKGRLILILKISAAVGLITYMVRAGHLDPKDLWALMTPLNVILAITLVGLNIFTSAWRWIILLRARGFIIPMGYGFSLYLVGLFFNFAIPGAVGGDLVRGYYLVADYPQRKLDGILSILIDRILGLYSFFILTLIAVAYDFEFVSSHEKIRWVALLASVIFAAMTLFFVVAFSERLSRLMGFHLLEKRVAILHKLLGAFQMYGKNRSVIALSVMVSLLAQCFSLFFFYHLAQDMGETDITWAAVLFAVPMGFLVTAIPISPAGIGVGQVAFLYLFQAYVNRSTQFGATAITAFQLSLAVWALAGAVFYLRRKKPHDLEDIAREMA